MRNRGTIFLLAALAVPAAAQPNVASGELHGTVTDPTGAAIPGAKVGLKSGASGLSRTTTTEITGEYRFLVLPPGLYDLKVEKDGFPAQVARDVRVTVGQIAIVNFKLELGVSTQLVEVSASPLLVESERSHQANT